MTDWDERYRTGDTPWDKGAAAPPLLELLDRLGTDIFGSGTVLVPGCGLGYDVRALAGKGIRAIGLDISQEAMQRAGVFPLVGEESYELGDFLDPNWRKGRKYGAIWEHTCFCAIDPSRRSDYAEAAAEVLEDGGLLAGVFYLNPFGAGERAIGPPFGTSVEELEKLFSPCFEKVGSWVPERAYPGREGKEWIGIFRKRANPSVAAKT
jgi:methyl halide transferase